MPRLCRNSGMSLMEVLIAMFLLTTVGMTVLNVFSSAGGLVRTQRHTAFNIARQELEKLPEAVRQDWWGDVARPLGTAHADPGAVTVNATSFDPSYTVTSSGDQDGDGIEDYRQVEMSVTW